MIIPQIERFATKYVFNKLTTRIFEGAMNEMATKSDEPTGNSWVFICNTKMWQSVQGAKDYVDLGATYQSYEFAGKSILLPAAA